MSVRTHAVVLGGGLGGVLAASVLARHVDAVTLVERDSLPEGPEFRKGVPQARHAHLYMSGGARIIESLLPGTTARLLAAGAHQLVVPEQAVWLTAYGWQHRFPSTEFIISASRPLLDWVVRDEATREPRITVLDGTEVIGPCGGAERITGVRVRNRQTDEESTVDADLVVDATGRGSPVRRWLAELGLSTVQQDVVDSGVAYATRIFRAPNGGTPFPIINILADHRVPRPGRNASLTPIEGDRWIVTLSGTRGVDTPQDEAAFLEFARRMRHPVIGELIAAAEPLTEVYGSRSTANRRQYYERMADWPEGLVAIGDAVAAFNPVYGHGMSVAARSAQALDRELTERGISTGTGKRVQQAVGVAVDDAWILAASQDLCYPGVKAEVTDPRLTRGAREQSRSFSDLIGSAALRDPVISEAAAKVTTLVEPMSSLEAPHIVAALRRGAQRPALTKPPLTEQETWFLRTEQTV